MVINTNSIKKFIDIVSDDKKEIYAIYFYSTFNGLVQLSLPIGIQSIISFVLAGTISTSLVLLIVSVVIGVFISGLVQVNQMKIIEKIQQQLMVRYAFHYSHRIPKLDMKAIDDYYMPELVNRFFDTASLQKGISKLLLDVPTATIQILFGLVLLSVYHPVFIFFGVLLLLVLFFILRLSAAKGMATSIQESNYKYRIAGYIEEIARAVFAFKFSRNKQFPIQKMDGMVKGYLESRTAHFKVLLFQYWSLIIFKVLITAAMLIVGALLLIKQQLNIGQFIAAEIVILLVIGSVEKLIVNLDKVYDVLTSVEKINKVIEKPSEKTGTLQLEDDQKGLSINMRNVSFGYNAKKDILKNISLSIAPGQKVFIGGESSSGKSSLLKLLSGSLHDFEGKIDINHNPIGQYENNSFRSRLGILFTRQEIFEGSLLENLTMGNTIPSTRVIFELANIVGLNSFLESLPEGLNTLLLPNGNHLSQRTIKKILLIRAFLFDPKLLLLDDPFLGLENEVQNQIQDFIFTKMPNTTVVIASNDQIENARFDQKLVLEKGSIVG